MTLKSTAYHEAGHLVLARCKFFHEPDFPNPTKITIESKDDGGKPIYGQVIGLTFYQDKIDDTFSDITNIDYPKPIELKSNRVEKDKIRKQAIMDLAGRISEYIFCEKCIPEFISDGSTDMKKVSDIVNLLLECEDPDYDMNDDVYSTLRNSYTLELWALGYEKMQEPAVKKAIEYVVEQLLQRKTIDGAEITALCSKVDKILREAQ
jgi:hypothetical protein